MFCTNCGKENPAASKFCTMCGAPLNPRPQGQDAPTKEQPAQETSQAPQHADESAPEAMPALEQQPAPEAPTTVMPAVVPEADPTQVVPAQQAPADDTVQGDVQQQAKQARRRSRGKMPMMLFVILIALAAAGAAFATYYVYTQVWMPEQQRIADEKAQKKADEKAEEEQKAAEKEAEEQKEAEEKAAKEAEEQAAKEAEEQAAQEQATEAEHQQKIADAQAQGKTVLTGTIHVFNSETDLVNYYNDDELSQLFYQGSGGYDNGPRIVLELDAASSVDVASDGPASPRTVSRVFLDQGKESRVLDMWKPYDGTHATVALTAPLTRSSDASISAVIPGTSDATILF